MAFVTLFLALCLVAGLLLSEAALRVFLPQPLGPPFFAYDEDMGQVPVPGQASRRTFSEDPPYSAENTENGLRRTTDSASAALGMMRILILGDSFTYGVGVDDDGTMASGLARLLNAKSRRPVAVFNAGNPGTGSDYALRFLHSKGDKYAPDVVVVNFFQNDFADNQAGLYYDSSGPSLQPKDITDGFGFYRNKQGIQKIPGYRWLCERSHLLSLARKLAAYLKISSGTGPLGAFLRNRPDSAALRKGFSDDSAVALAGLIFREIKGWSAEHRAHLLVTYVPSVEDLRHFLERREASRDERAFHGVARRLDLHFISFSPVLAASGEPLSALYLNEGHWTRRAHQLAAQALAAALKP